ncbi:hypothetical protein ACFLRH_01800 [Actinomycetota bacterium]
MTIGWFVSGDVRHPGRLFLELDGEETLEVRTGSEFRLVRRNVPDDHVVRKESRYEFGPAPSDHPVAKLIGAEITMIQTVTWHGYLDGVIVSAGGLKAVIVDDADEIFVSDGNLPSYMVRAEIADADS